MLLLSLFMAKGCQEQEAVRRADLIIYGGTSAGIAAAVQASRMGNSVILIEPSDRIGGLTTGGLGQTDIGNKQAIGGISREFYRRIRSYYERLENWEWQDPEVYRDGGQTRTEAHEDAMWTFEPSAALDVYHAMIAEEDIPLRSGVSGAIALVWNETEPHCPWPRMNSQGRR